MLPLGVRTILVSRPPFDRTLAAGGELSADEGIRISYATSGPKRRSPPVAGLAGWRLPVRRTRGSQGPGTKDMIKYTIRRGGRLAEVLWAMTEGWIDQVGDRRSGSCRPVGPRPRTV